MNLQTLGEKGGTPMARIKIKDLPKDQKISKAEMKAVLGGVDYMNRAILPQGEDLIKSETVQLFGGVILYPYGGIKSLYGAGTTTYVG
jgi:hypothetical protein